MGPKTTNCPLHSGLRAIPSRSRWWLGCKVSPAYLLGIGDPGATHQEKPQPPGSQVLSQDSPEASAEGHRTRGLPQPAATLGSEVQL